MEETEEELDRSGGMFRLMFQAVFAGALIEAAAEACKLKSGGYKHVNTEKVNPPHAHIHHR